MGAKLKKIKSKQTRAVYGKGFTDKVAEMVGCTRRMVAYVLAEEANMETPTAQRILLAVEMLKEEERLAIERIKKVVSSYPNK